MSRKAPNPPPPPGAVKPPPPTEPPPARTFVPVAYPDGSYGRGLPILQNHDPAAVVGVLSSHAGSVLATFKRGAVPLEALAGIGGGWRVLELQHVGPGEEYVLKAELILLSTVNAREGQMSATKTVQLGDRVKDRVTGFTGIAVGTTEWLNGCRRIGVQSEKLEDGKPKDPQWFDEPQLDVVKTQVHTPFAAQIPPAATAPAAPRRRGGPQHDPSARRAGE